MPGAFSLAALANRVVPAGAARRLLRPDAGTRAGDRVPGPLRPLLVHGARAPARAAVAGRAGVPLFTGVFYTAFSAPLRAAYLAYEELAWRRGWRNLPPYYLITATAPG